MVDFILCSNLSKQLCFLFNVYGALIVYFNLFFLLFRFLDYYIMKPHLLKQFSLLKSLNYSVSVGCLGWLAFDKVDVSEEAKR